MKLKPCISCNSKEVRVLAEISAIICETCDLIFTYQDPTVTLHEVMVNWNDIKREE